MAVERRAYDDPEFDMGSWAAGYDQGIMMEIMASRVRLEDYYNEYLAASEAGLTSEAPRKLSNALKAELRGMIGE